MDSLDLLQIVELLNYSIQSSVTPIPLLRKASGYFFISLYAPVLIKHVGWKTRQTFCENTNIGFGWVSKTKWIFDSFWL